MTASIDMQPQYPELPDYPDREPFLPYPTFSRKFDALYGVAGLVGWAVAVVTVFAFGDWYKTHAPTEKLTFDNGFGLGMGSVIWIVMIGVVLTWALSAPLRRHERKARDARNAEQARREKAHEEAVEAWSAERKQLLDDYYAEMDRWWQNRWHKVYLPDPAND